MCESWNGALNDYRRKPIIDLLEFIRLKVMKRLIKRREKVLKWEVVPPRVREKLGKIAKLARKLLVIKASNIEFEVVDQVIDKERHYVVDLQQIYCECGGW